MLPFEPEAEITLKARYADAIQTTFNLNEIEDDPDKRPGLIRKHVFDFYDGLRLIVSKDTDGQRTYLHYSASYNNVGQFESLQEYIVFIIEHVNTLRGKEMEGRLTIMASPSNGIVHLMYDILQEQLEGLKPPADPRMN